MKQLRESENEIVLLHATVEDLNAYGAWLSTQVVKVSQKAVLVQGELIEARWEAVVAMEVARATENVVKVVKEANVAASNNAQDVDL